MPETWRFSIDVARSWEDAAVEACPAGTRLALLRSAMIMSPDRGGVFDTLHTLGRRGLGGTAAGGRQCLSWIHEADFVTALPGRLLQAGMAFEFPRWPEAARDLVARRKNGAWHLSCARASSRTRTSRRSADRPDPVRRPR